MYPNVWEGDKMFLSSPVPRKRHASWKDADRYMPKAEWKGNISKKPAKASSLFWKLD